MTGAKRVPGHPIGNCAGSSNNLVPRGAKLSAIDVKAKAFFERLYLVLGLSPFEPRVNYGVALVSRIDKIIGLFCKRAL